MADEDDSTASWSFVSRPGQDVKREEEQEQPEAAPALELVLRNLRDSVGVAKAVDKSHVCLTVTARELPDEAKRAAVDIMIALDVSGSMQGNKLALCKETLTQLVRLLSAKDRFGLITYDSHAQLDFALRKMTPDNKSAALRIVQKLNTRGRTNIQFGHRTRVSGTPRHYY